MTARSLALATLVVLAGPAASEVLDLDSGEFRNRPTKTGRLVGSVLDLERPPEDLSPIEEVRVAPERTTGATGRRPQGRDEVERQVLEVGSRYLRHPGIRKAGLSGREWLALYRANIAVESNFHQSARSDAGAIGLGQLMPETARELGVDPYDAEQNLQGSARYLLTQLEAFGSVELALAAYNAGPVAVSRYNGIPPYRETRGHVAKVLKIFHATNGQEAV